LRHLAEVFGRAARGEAGPPGAGASRAVRLSLADLLRRHGDDSAAVLLMVMAMACVTPIAGVGTLLGGVIFAIAWRWHRGPHAGVLPERLGRVTLSEAWSRRSLHGFAWMYATADRLLEMRLTLMLHHGTYGWWRLWIATMALLIVLPLPLGNVLPGLSLVLLALGGMFRDGLVLLLSGAVGLGAIGFAVAMGHVLLEGVRVGAQWLAGLV
jgi:hypothetical protein